MKSLSLAIANQLKMIAEQTRVLNQMQNELQSITTGSISNEVRELLDERSRLEQREEQLKAELRQVSQQINLINIELENKEKEKAEKIKTLANKSAQYGILKKPIARPTQANGHPHSAPQRSQ
jgi:NTP pyrophosphatase (non-canonical NTP hydrolase)